MTDFQDIFRGGFSEPTSAIAGYWATIMSAFEADEPVPDEVIFAEYSDEGYDGSAVVLYRNGPQFFYVSGSHCSCYGLEDQWEPEAYTPDTLLAQTLRANGGFFKDERERIFKALKPYLNNKAQALSVDDVVKMLCVDDTPQPQPEPENVGDIIDALRPRKSLFDFRPYETISLNFDRADTGSLEI